MFNNDKSHRTWRTTKEKNVQTVTVLKLLNSYAESYKILENENKSLKQYISDLKTNLKVSKQIIDTFISKNSENKYQEIILNLQKDNKTSSEINEELTKKNLQLQKEFSKFKEIISNLREEIEDLKTKKFILEESLLKKDSIIMAQKKGLSKNQYIVIHPNKALVKLNDELITYKLIYERISNYLKKSDEKIDKYETVIANLQTEKEQIQIQNKLKLYSVNRENENLKYKLRNTINTLNDDKSYRSTNTPKINNINLHFNSNHNENRNKLPFQNSEKSNKSNRSIEDEEFSKNSSFNNSFNNEEFKEILKQAGLTIENYLILSSNKMNAKLIDTIELMFKLITDKNMTIRILEIENENLNEKNTQLNEENISILSKKNNESMANNTSKITINNLNINSLNAYKNILNKNESISSKEETGSIIVMKKKQNLNKEEISEKNRCKSSQLSKERILTLENSITSSEFGRECKGINSFSSSFGNIDD
jgi:hypothetical protein